MPRPRSETPKEHTSIIRAKRKDGWTYVNSRTRANGVLTGANA